MPFHSIARLASKQDVGRLMFSFSTLQAYHFEEVMPFYAQLDGCQVWRLVERRSDVHHLYIVRHMSTVIVD